MKNLNMDILDYEPKMSQILKEVLVGLSMSQKTIHPKYLYDKKGSEIFEKICLLKEYYPTRTETNILKTAAKEIAGMIGDGTQIIEPGSGSGEKIRYLLPHLKNVSYVPIEISKNALIRMTEELHTEFPEVEVLPVCADFTQVSELPLSVGDSHNRKMIFFPGSTIGNFHPPEALQLLKKFHSLINKNGGLLIGVDLKKDKEVLKEAYDDAEGVTAEFNLNLLERLNREAFASFDSANFFHEAFYNEDLGRVEMHLVSKIPQLVRVHQTVFRFKEGETIHTESSYKYTVEEFARLASKAKFTLKKVWTDPSELFCVYYFEV